MRRYMLTKYDLSRNTKTILSTPYLLHPKRAEPILRIFVLEILSNNTAPKLAQKELSFLLFVPLPELIAYLRTEEVNCC